MAFVGLKLPHEAARLLAGVEVPGERHSASDMHVTVLYLGKGLSIVDVAKAMCASSSVVSSTRPFVCGVQEVSSFPAGDDGLPVICPVLSPGLVALHGALRDEFTRLGIGFSNKYPEYRPHTTLSYVKDGSVDSYSSPLPGPLTWTASELVIWGGDEMDELVSISLPFVLSPLERVARRVCGSSAVRFT